MHTRFSLFHSHIDLAHKHWSALLHPGDTAIDATCGNGHDTLLLAQLILTPDAGALYALDLQPAAIESTRAMLEKELPAKALEKVHFFEGCHTKFPGEIPRESIQLIVYNLGYLPGGDKSITTLPGTTLKSLNEAANLIKAGGMISATCYPGHSAGEVEEEEVEAFAASLDPKVWSCCYHRWVNRNKSPSLFLMQKRV